MQRVAKETPTAHKTGWYTLQAAVTYIVMTAALWCVFVYVPTDNDQGIVQRIFYFHVSSATTMSVAFFIVCVASIIYLWKQSQWWDHVALSAAEIGVVFCTIVLITGPIWARPIWNVWWRWDPVLTLTLVLWLIYVAYLMLRADASDANRTRFAAVLGIVGFADIFLIRWAVVKMRTIHPKPIVGQPDSMPTSMSMTLYIAMVACVLLFFFLLRERASLEQHRHELETLRDEVENELVR